MGRKDASRSFGAVKLRQNGPGDAGTPQAGPRASAALDLLPENEETRQGRDVLQTALDEAEEIYIATDEEQDRP